MDSVIYYVYCFSTYNGLVHKVGLAKNPAFRLKDVQWGNHKSLYLRWQFALPTRDKAYELESKLHAELKEHRAEGGKEWFECAPNVVWNALISSVRFL